MSDNRKHDMENQGVVPILVDDSPQLREPEKCGVLSWWPEDGIDWIHPDDVELACRMIPSPRIFRREIGSGDYPNVLVYAGWRIRIKPVLWLEVESDGYELGDRIEVRSKMGQRKPFIATIRDMFWNRRYRRVDYFLRTTDQILSTPFLVGDFQPAFRLDQPMSLRQRELHDKSRLR